MNVRVAEPTILSGPVSQPFFIISHLSPRSILDISPPSPIPTPQALEWPDADIPPVGPPIPSISSVHATLAGAGSVCACCHPHFRDSAVGGCLALSGGISVWEWVLPPACCSNGDFWAPGVQRRCKNLSVTGQRN